MMDRQPYRTYYSSHRYSTRTFVSVLSQALACLVEARHNVLMSDGDALWLKDPIEDMKIHGMDQSDLATQRGSFPVGLGKRWGATMCMGFVVFRSGTEGAVQFVSMFERLVRENGDDQVTNPRWSKR